MKLHPDLIPGLRCPASGRALEPVEGWLQTVGHPVLRYPVIEGVPVLINESNSLFTIAGFQQRADTTFTQEVGLLRRLLRRCVPGITANVRARRNYARLAGLLPPDARVLVVGGSIAGQGIEAITANAGFRIVSTDVSFGPCTQAICDAHDLPFADGFFDAVIIQAVLEHVLDPHRCVAEIHRVLKADGLVYAETPFMQQVHMQQYDFTRFTHLGHRRLFRHFSEVDSGPACGPGSALAWSYTYLLRSLARSRRVAGLFTAFGCLTSFYLKYLDYLLIDRPGSFDAASGYYFLGRRSTDVLGDHELVAGFKGLA